MWEEEKLEQSILAKQKAKQDLTELKLTNRFCFEEEINTDKSVWVIYGEKGDGKTVLSMLIGLNAGVVACLSFDHKTTFIKKYFFDDNVNIKVYDGLKHFLEEPEKKLDSAVVTFEYLMFLLDNIKNEVKPDYILIDGSEKFTTISELCMRKNNDIKLYSGVTNQNLWKERKDYLIKLHRLAIESAKKGVIYTTYTHEDKIIKDGTIIVQQKIPKWTGIILEESDIVVNTYSTYDKFNGKKFFLCVDNSKIKTIKTGYETEVTNKNYKEIFK